MNKQEEDKLVNAIIGLHQEMKKQGESTQKQLAKINLALGEMRVSYMKLDERVNKLDISISQRIRELDDSFKKYAESNNNLFKNHEIRLVRLEEKTSGNAYIASEPTVHYMSAKRPTSQGAKRKKRK